MNSTRDSRSKQPAFAKKHKFENYLAKCRTIGIWIGTIAAGFAACFSAYYLLTDDAPTVRGALLFPIATWLTVTAASVGIALLFAPSDYFSTGQGKAYLEKIGVETPVGARAAIAIALSIGLLIIGFVIYQIVRVSNL